MITLGQIAFALFVIGAVLMFSAFFVGESFYPPGEGYAEEERAKKIGSRMISASVVCFTLGFALTVFRI